MRYRQEFYISFFGAVAVCAGMFVLASTISFIDLGNFRRQVEQLFRVDFSPVVTLANNATQEDTTLLAGKMAIGQTASLFAREPQMPDVPQLGLDKFPDSSAEVMELPAQPPLGLSMVDNGLSAIVGGTLPGGGESGEDIIALRRKISGEDGVFKALIENDKRTVSPRVILKPHIFEIKPEIQDIAAPQMATEVDQPQLTGGDFILPSEVEAKMQGLLRFRPAGGYPSLESEMVSRFYLEKLGGQNYFRVEFSLRPESTLPVLTKDVLFLVDVSQSITSEQIKAARNAIVYYLRELPQGDRWNVYTFSEQTHSFTKDYNFLPARSFDESALGRFIRRPVNEFMTDIFDATSQILRRIPASNRPCNIFLISDGKANYSTVDVRRIVQGFSRERRDNFSIFTFMIGSKGDPDLLRLLAYRSRGFFARGEASVASEVSLLGFFRKFDQPVLSSCVASYTNLEAGSVFPVVLPNLYRGVPVVFSGRSADPGSFVIRVMGLGDGGGPREFYFRPSGRQPLGGVSIYREWALGLGYDLVQKIIDAPDKATYNQRLNELRRLISDYGLDNLQAMATLLQHSER